MGSGGVQLVGRYDSWVDNLTNEELGKKVRKDKKLTDLKDKRSRKRRSADCWMNHVVTNAEVVLIEDQTLHQDLYRIYLAESALKIAKKDLLESMEFDTRIKEWEKND